MRYLILSDIHANGPALDAVLAESQGLHDAILSCGDLVGYGPDPNYIADFFRQNRIRLVRGNHDKAAAGLIDLEWFNPLAKLSALWTAAELSAENREWIRDLPGGPVELDGFSLCHGSPADEDEYIIAGGHAREAAQSVVAAVSFFGHTHVQGGFQVTRFGVRVLGPNPEVTDETSTWLVNPGSVGQPRDGDPRAAWAIFDTSDRTVEYFRTIYDVEETHRRILDLGLPEVLALRLYQGL